MNLKPIFGTVLGLVLSAGAAVCEQDLSLVEVEVHKLEPSYYTSSKGSHPSIKTMDIKKLYSQEDLELLAHVINAEQGIEFENEELTNKLQIYTGQVVLNRVKCHHKGADTIEEVIEPFLLKLGFLQRTPRGRVISDLGCEYLGAPRIKRGMKAAPAQFDLLSVIEEEEHGL